MKKILFTAIVLFQAAFVFSQKSNMVFFTENDEMFTVSLNGIKYNSSPQVNVKATHLNKGLYSVKIVFANSSVENITDQLNLDAGVEVTFMLKQVRASGAEKGVKKLGKGLFSTKPDSVIQKEKADVDNDKGKYVLEFLTKTKISEEDASSSNITSSAPVQNNTAGQPEQPQYRGSGDPLKGLNVAKSKEMVVGNYYALIIGIDNYSGQWHPFGYHCGFDDSWQDKLDGTACHDLQRDDPGEHHLGRDFSHGANRKCMQAGEDRPVHRKPAAGLRFHDSVHGSEFVRRTKAAHRLGAGNTSRSRRIDPGRKPQCS